jgi:hypothetical protein
VLKAALVWRVTGEASTGSRYSAELLPNEPLLDVFDKLLPTLNWA